MTARVYRAADDAPEATTGVHRKVTEAPELVRLRVLWHELRARGMDCAAAPGIAYDRPVVQTSSVTPTLPHGFGMGRARDLVGERLAAMPAGEARATLVWYRGYDASGAWQSGSVEAILDAAVRALATEAQLAAWVAAATEVRATQGGRQAAAHVTAAGRTWARARMARAWDAWAASAAERTGV